MKARTLFPFIILSLLILINWISVGNTWYVEIQRGYKVHFTSIDRNNIEEYNKLIVNGIKSVKSFFSSSDINNFDVYIHPYRQSLDSTWQKDWNIPDFRSECWMVASGNAWRLDVISPKKWDSEACEHLFADSIKTQQIITHEMVHVLHGQLNISPDFSNAEGIDWFVEGLATYVSGQCGSAKIEEIRQAVSDNNVPVSLENFWTGKLRYGLSGSVVMYIDNRYGRTELKKLLWYNKKSDILESLKTTESELLSGWKTYIQKH
jgi:hypothetical protein